MRATRAVARVSRPQMAVRALSTEPGFIQKYGLDDWKRTMPLGIFLSIPLIQNEVLILSEETQLVGCFALFAGTVYTLGSDAIAEMLDAKGKAIIAQHNALEDEAIASIEEVVLAHENRVSLLSELKVIAAAQATGLAELKAAKTMELEHVVRNDTLKKLETLVLKEEQTRAAITAKLLAEASASVESTLKTDAAIKAALLDEAIKTIANPKATEGKGDVVTGLFQKYFADRSAAAKAQAGKPTELSAEALAELNDEIAALAKRDSISASVAMPSSVSL